MAKRFTADYTAGEIMEMYQLRSKDRDEGRLRDLATEFRELTRLQRDPEIPSAYKATSRVVKTPFMRDAWFRITSSLVAKSPIAHITPKDEKRQEYREAANLGERFDMAMLERFNKERGTDIVFALTAQLVRDGESVLKVVHRPDAWANFPEREEGQDADDYREKADDYKRGVDLPIAWRDVDRMSVVYEGGEYGDDWVIEYGEYAKPYMKARYGMRENEQGRLIDPKRVLEGRPYPEGMSQSANGYVKKMEFFTSREWHVIIDGSEAPGFPKKNPYAPYLPYFRAPAYDLESLLYSLLFLVPRLDELLTMKLNWAYLGAYPNPVLEDVPNSQAIPTLDGAWGNSGDAAGTAGQTPVTWTPGKLMVLPLGKKLSFLVPPPVGDDLNQLAQMFKSLIDIAGVPSIMRGVSGAGDSGYLANQLRAAAEMAYKLAAISSQRQLEKATEFSHWIISNIVQQTVYVLGWQEINSKTGKPNVKAGNAWLGLNPDSQSKNVAAINKLGPISFQYRPTLPTDGQANAMIALQLTNAEKPLYDRRTALETYMQEEDPESILDAISVDQAMEEEPLKGMYRDAALREAGIIPPPPPPALPTILGPNGMPIQGGMLPPGPGQLQPVPMANQAMPGQPGVPGVTMPIQPTPPGPPSSVGVAGAYPGQPGGPNR